MRVHLKIQLQGHLIPGKLYGCALQRHSFNADIFRLIADAGLLFLKQSADTTTATDYPLSAFD